MRQPPAQAVPLAFSRPEPYSPPAALEVFLARPLFAIILLEAIPCSHMATIRPAIPSTHTSSPRWRLSFWALMFTQFQTAFNDNALKFLVIYIIVDMGLPDAKRDWLVLCVGALFALPFILFSMTGGYLADRFSKRAVIIGTKWLELATMLFSLAALGWASLPLELTAVFLLSAQSALFGPSKYGLLPEVLPERDLSWGNGIVEFGTFTSAIAATVGSGFLAYYFRGRQIWSGISLMAFTILGIAASVGISRVPAAFPGRRLQLFGDFFSQLRRIRAQRLLSWAVVGNTYLWFLAALLQFTIVIYGHDILHVDERHISYLQAAVGLGIGLGSLATGYLSAGKIEYGLIPLGAFGLSFFGFLSAGHGLSLLRAGVYLGLVGFSGGFYAVPLNALIQHRPDPAHKGGVIAAANLLSFVGVFLAAGMYFFLASILHLRADRIFFAGACMTLAAGLYAIVFFPNSLLRLAILVLVHTRLCVRLVGRDNIPDRGSALFVSGPMSITGVIALSACTDRLITFVAEDGAISDATSLAVKALRLNTVPVQSNENGDRPQFAHLLRTTLQMQEVVCLVARSAADSASCYLRNPTVQRIMLEANAPLVPIRVHTLPSKRPAARASLWRRIVYFRTNISVCVGEPILAVRMAELGHALTSSPHPPTLTGSES